MDEHELIARVRAGDAAAERRLYDRHVDRIYRLAYRFTGDDTLAQDLTQDTFIRAFERLDGFRGESALGTWLHAIATTVILNGLRKVKRFRQRETDLDDAATIGADRTEADPDLKHKLARAVDALPMKYRTVFVLHDVEGFKHESHPKLEIHRPALGKPPLYRNDKAVVAVATDALLPAPHPQQVDLNDTAAVGDCVLAHARPLADVLDLLAGS